MSVKYDLKMARVARDYVRKMMPFGVANYKYSWHVTDSTLEAFFKNSHARRDASLTLEGMRSCSVYRAGALNAGAGCCAEMATLAYLKLKAMGLPCLSLMMINDLLFSWQPFKNDSVPRKSDEDSSHAFVVINADHVVPYSEHALGTNCYEWGENAVICDPWLPLVKTAYEAGKVWPNYLSAATALEMVNYPNKRKSSHV